MRKWLEEHHAGNAMLEWVGARPEITTLGDLWRRDDLPPRHRVWLATRPGVLDDNGIVRFVHFYMMKNCANGEPDYPARDKYLRDNHPDLFSAGGETMRLIPIKKSEEGLPLRQRTCLIIPSPKLGARKIPGKSPVQSDCVTRLNKEINRRRKWWQKLRDALLRTGESQ